MGTISKPYTFTAGTNAVAAEVNSDLDTVYNEINGNLDNANIKASAGIVDTKLATISTAGKVSGAALTSLASIPAGAGVIPYSSMETTSWTNYSATSTILGWTTYTQKLIYYKRVGKTVFVTFQLEGTSNATTSTFSLPVAVSNTVPVYTNCYSIDNNVASTGGGMIIVTKNTTVTNLYFDCAATVTWTNTGTKACNGQFFYDIA